MDPNDYYYSDKYEDEQYEYRYAFCFFVPNICFSISLLNSFEVPFPYRGNLVFMFFFLQQELDFYRRILFLNSMFIVLSFQ